MSHKGRLRKGGYRGQEADYSGRWMRTRHFSVRVHFAEQGFGDRIGGKPFATLAEWRVMGRSRRQMLPLFFRWRSSLTVIHFSNSWTVLAQTNSTELLPVWWTAS
jgi:hypothetical protein